MTTSAVDPENNLAALQAALAAERVARQEAEARATSAEAMVAYLKLLIAKMKRDRFGQSAERGRQLLDPAGIAARGVGNNSDRGQGRRRAGKARHHNRAQLYP